MRIGLLGAFEVQVDGAPVNVPGARSRALLAALALEPGRIVQKTRLVDWVWGEEPPSDEANALQVLVSRLRKGLPKGVVESKAGGYVLAVEPDAVDVSRFEALVGRARNADDAEKADLLREALNLWRGTAMEGISLLGSKAFDAVVVGLNERYVQVLGDRVDAEIRLGRGADLVTELHDLVARYPMREGFVAALMRALAEAGRSAEALTVYQQLAERLGDELGVDPSAELSALNIALLRGEIGGRTENRRTNLRSELTAFVGKEDDVAAVADLASRHRLVTLNGPGGAGKTRLAVETARTMLGDLPDGAWLVELAALQSGDELAQAVLTAIGLRDQQGAAGGDATDRLTAAIRDRVMLLVLDNCEHVIEEVSQFTDRLLGECRSLRIIATSREPLGITGEALWQVEPLALPAEDATPQEAAASPAVKLLRDRAEAVRRNIGGDDETLATMARICRALDGMPLAIELAAARLRTMSVDQLADRIDDRFQLLTGGSRTAMAHHRTLRAVVDWSWDLLSEAERELLRRLSVFTGGVSIEAAERVCPDGEYALDLLTTLTEKSLLRTDGEGEPRYRMLNTIREYAAQRLAEDGDPVAARRDHLAYVTELAETADPHLRGPEQLVWLKALETEYDNIIAALRGAINDGWAPEAMRLVAAISWFWFLSGHRAEGTELAVAAGSLEGDVPDDVRALSGTMIAMFLTSGYGGDQYQAQEWIQSANAAAERSGVRHQIIGFIKPLARMLEAPADFLSAFDPLVEDEDAWVRAQARLARGRLRLMIGSDETDVDSDMEQSLAEFRQIGDRWGVSSVLNFVAQRLAARGEFVKACKLFDETATALAELGSTEEVVSVRARQAQLYWLSGDERASAAALQLAERFAAGIAWPAIVAELTFAKAHLARWRGDRDEARALLATVRTDLGADGNGIAFSQKDMSGYLVDDLDEARTLRSEALATAVGMSYPPMIAEALIGIADLAVRQGKDEDAVKLLAAAEVVRGSVDLTLWEAVRLAEDAQDRLGAAKFAEAKDAGREADWNALAEAVLAS
ncbi:BTAD domain-containing putative transcriptional regulator [Glycomyces sp. NPDC048151]|uniref:BTAD domain-containing putative transcriptional regulator n=1 Tax=Glycomyces sp. NPDC048151 TaxID=3364002 RepID=UPI00371350F8